MRQQAYRPNEVKIQGIMKYTPSRKCGALGFNTLYFKTMDNQVKKILIVEDDQLLIKILFDEFEKNNFKVFLASNGQEGLEKALYEKPDLILLDIVMPIMDGLTMLKKLRAQKEGASIPVMILTNLSGAETIEKGVQSGSYDFLVKANWDLKDIVNKVKSKLGVS